MTSRDIRLKYLDFFKARGHTEIEPAKLVIENDPSTLFTSAGMQPLIPYLKGEKSHPGGGRLVDSQPCFRSQDIEEVGDNRHTTFFEMLGNWSLGDYFKKEQLSWIWEFLTEELKLPKDKLYISLFEGGDGVEKDLESFEIWKSLGVSDSHIHYYDARKNWWSLSGTPAQMKEGEIGGPDCEIFYEFDFISHDPKFGEKCHPNCDCGRFLEIANSVFIQYQKTDNSVKELSNKNVDFGGGLERLAAAVKNEPDIFRTDLYAPIIETIEKYSGKSYSDLSSQSQMRVIADHLKAATFLIVSGVTPSNKMQGYVLRRLIRRVAVKMHELRGNPKKSEIPTDAFEAACAYAVLEIYHGFFGIDKEKHRQLVVRVIVEEMEKFGKSLELGLKEFERYITFKMMGRPETEVKMLSPKDIFRLYESFGFPYELSKEVAEKKGITVPDRIEFDLELEQHKSLSRTASAGKFAGGLAGHSEIEIKYHTATHLLHQALRDVLGPEVFQKGSNITPERLRFDFSFDRKLTDEEIKQVEELVNAKISEDLKVDRKFMTYEEAKELNAIGLFDEKYKNLESSPSEKLYGSESRTLPFADAKGDKSNVSIYAIGPDYILDPNAKDQRKRGNYYSLEFCGGPHVEHTGIIRGIKIAKEEAVSQGIRRIRAQLS